MGEKAEAREPSHRALVSMEEREGGRHNVALAPGRQADGPWPLPRGTGILEPTSPGPWTGSWSSMGETHSPGDLGFSHPPQEM